ncbi:MAG TPA: ATP-binding SpoIIE family protein phosphatase [Actinospica sp.]|jgi:anti-sigma regulatory factor (Ser/Thr protein kinase)|nr:ATP-binding SpoIIE family protein phosphatase [Actinospica sp.]
MPNTSSVPEVAGVRLAYRRQGDLTAGEGGGDWSDSVRLPGNRLMLAVGHVLGSGLPAPTVADQFRSAVRVLTQLDLSPAQVLHRLDVLAESLGEQYTSTCVYVSCDLSDGTAVFASAGHLPPLLRTPYDPAYRVALPPGAPLGLGGVEFEERQYTIPPGSLLALYTDGLLGHALGEDADLAIAELGRRLDKGHELPDEQLEQFCEHVSSVMLGHGEHTGDATLVLAKLGRMPEADTAAWTLTARPTAVAQARDLIRDRLLGWGLHGLADVVELLVSELVTNALRYGIAPFGLRLTRDARNVMVEVSDGNPTVPRLRHVQVGDEGGRGLHLVDELSADWGVRSNPQGKTVWFTLGITEH